ncbi:MAG: hypothetical protein F6J98_46155 [Moorea sp. SIO4G2]|nr:hypothetical protein [Moorena sp. SIO4G2]
MPVLPIPDSRFPIPDSRFPIPDSLIPTPYLPIPEWQSRWGNICSTGVPLNGCAVRIMVPSFAITQPWASIITFFSWGVAINLYRACGTPLFKASSTNNIVFG